jgi:aryl-alcohol dehydrogenase-like predicted oxidoreductase
MCLDAGVNLIDTSNTYSSGLSEEILGEALAGGRRGRVLLATKGRGRMGDGVNERGLSRHYLIEQCENSLRRLRTDHIDLYQLHFWDGTTPLEETVRALDDLQRSGKVRYVGVSNFSGWHLMKLIGVAGREGAPPIVSHQIHYTLQAREAEYELVPIAIDQGVGLLVWSPLAGGLLTGKYRRDGTGPDGARHMGAWSEPPIRDRDALFDLIEVLTEVARAEGCTPAQLALAYLLRRPGVVSLVIGARTAAQLADNLAAVALNPSAAAFARLDAASAPPLIYPYWHQARTIGDRLGAADRSLLEPHLPQRA